MSTQRVYTSYLSVSPYLTATQEKMTKVFKKAAILIRQFQHNCPLCPPLPFLGGSDSGVSALACTSWNTAAYHLHIAVSEFPYLMSALGGGTMWSTHLSQQL